MICKHWWLEVVMLLCCVQFLQAQPVERKIDGRVYRVEELFYENFEKDLSNWQVEGDARVRLIERRLDVNAMEGPVKSSTIWCKREFTGPQIVEYDVRLMGDSYQSNINMFLCAAHPEGILNTGGQRTGQYSQYHQFPNYLITILNDTDADKRETLRFRMRLDPGFQLVQEGWYEPLIFGQTYRITYILQPPEVTVYLNEFRLGSVVYAATLETGHHGLRIWHTHSTYDNFTVSRILSD